MICAASNSRTSFENIDRWRAEIAEVKAYAPKVLILTKSDLLDEIDEDERVDFKMLVKKNKAGGF